MKGYLILNPATAISRDLLADLMEHGLAGNESKMVLWPADREEREVRSEPAFEAVESTWTRTGDGVSTPDCDEFSHVFFVSDPMTNPVDQVEWFHAWLERVSGEIGRVITVVDFQFLHGHPAAAPVYDACVHFSDVVLLDGRAGVPQKRVREFVDRYKKTEHMPCLFEWVKKGQVQNPALVLDVEARRLTMLFDMEDEWEEDEEPGEDPYLEKYPSGKRVREIPDIVQLLENRS